MPTVGIAIELRDQQGNAHRSEVLQRHFDQPGALVLSPPADLPAEHAFKAGTRLLVSWPEDGSYWVLPVLLIELRPDGASRLLVAEVEDDAWREERREFVRSASDATVLVDFEVEDIDGVAGPRGVAAELIDLSEVALRCVLGPEHREWIQPHIPMTVRVMLAGDKFELAAEILLAKPTARLDLGLEVVILFERPVARVEQLRAHLADRADR